MSVRRLWSSPRLFSHMDAKGLGMMPAGDDVNATAPRGQPLARIRDTKRCVSAMDAVALHSRFASQRARGISEKKPVTMKPVRCGQVRAGGWHSRVQIANKRARGTSYLHC